MNAAHPPLVSTKILQRLDEMSLRFDLQYAEIMKELSAIRGQRYGQKITRETFAHLSGTEENILQSVIRQMTEKGTTQPGLVLSLDEIIKTAEAELTSFEKIVIIKDIAAILTGTDIIVRPISKPDDSLYRGTMITSANGVYWNTTSRPPFDRSRSFFIYEN